MNTYSVVRKTTICFQNNDESHLSWENRDNYKHYKLFDKLMSYMGQIYFYVSTDKEIDKNFSCLSKDYREGHYFNLKFKAKRYPAGFEIVFYQDVIHKNPHGGYYDFDKYDKMPYLIKKQVELTINKIKKFLNAENIKDNTNPAVNTAEDKIKLNYVSSCHYPQKNMDFKLSDLDGETTDYIQNAKDRDGKILHNGEIKYFRDYYGYLMRGKIYKDLNMMWFVITDKYNYTVKSCNELFDLTNDEILGRKAKHNPLKEYIERKNNLAKSSIKELKNELKRRTVSKGV